VIVTGASSNHYHVLLTLLYTIAYYEPDTHTVIYDLGLGDYASDLNEHLQFINSITQNNMETRTFNFSEYPPHMNITVNAGEYAWKPVIMYDVLLEFKVNVLWIDAGSNLENNLAKAWQELDEKGFVSSFSDGDLSRWVYPTLFAQFPLVTARHMPMCNGAFAGFRYNSTWTQKIALPWKECAMVKECIAPKGSSRDNHRQDQSILSLLAAQEGMSYKSCAVPWNDYSISLWHDANIEDLVPQIEAKRKLLATKKL
jgi:hypothetical protein